MRPKKIAARRSEIKLSKVEKGYRKKEPLACLPACLPDAAGLLKQKELVIKKQFSFFDVEN